MPRYNQKLPEGIATFGGQLVPYANYTSQYAKGFEYREVDKYAYPLPPTLFKLKLRTAAEIRFADIVNKYMDDKIKASRVKYMILSYKQMQFDNMNNIIPKDEYEVQKMTSYMMSRKASEEFRRSLMKNWVMSAFRAEANTYAGHHMDTWSQRAQIATEEEFMSYLWFLISIATIVSTVMTAVYWYWKYGQGFECLPVH